MATRAFVNNDLTTYNRDTVSFFKRAALYDANLYSPIDTYVTTIKNGGYWHKMLFLNPYVGTTAWNHGTSLIVNNVVTGFAGFNPRFTFTGCTFSNAGVTGGTSACICDLISGVATALRNNISFGVYSTTNSQNALNPDIGYSSGFANLRNYMLIRNTSDQYYAENMATTASPTAVTMTDSTGFFASTRMLTPYCATSKNGIVLGSTALSTSSNIGGVWQINPRARVFNMSYLSLGLTDPEVLHLYNATQTLNVTLNRAV